jgi:hypothetical protein
VSFVSRLEEDKKGDEGPAKFSAKALFQTKDRTGQSEVADTVLNTTHQNQVGVMLSSLIAVDGNVAPPLFHCCRSRAFRFNPVIRIEPTRSPPLPVMGKWSFGT